MHVTESVESSLGARSFRVPALVKERPRNADLGLNPIAVGCLLATAAILMVSVPLASRLGLSIEFGFVGRLRLGALIALMIAWTYYFVSPGKRREWIVAEVLFAWMVMHVSAMVLGPAQYIAAAMNRPVVDHWLAASDAALGIHVPALAAWTWQHPVLSALLVKAYNSFQPQLLAVILVLGVLRDRRALWEYVFIFYVCAVTTIVCSAVFPVACAFTYYGFESTLDFSRFTAHFSGVRDGTMTVIPYGRIEGLVSLPSFHAAGGFMLMWAVRRHRLLLAASVMWNSLLIASTVLSGAHYMIDVVAAAVQFGLTAWAYHAMCRRWPLG